jgi:hypothetical protein
MRIAGGIVGIFLSLIILVQSLAAGTANALADEGQSDNGGSIGFLVALLFVIGSGLLLGKVLRGATWVWAAAAVVAFAGAGTIFKDLIVWGFVAAIYAVASYAGQRRSRQVLLATAAPGSQFAGHLAAAVATQETHRECPFCKERMRRDASVCPHCRNESPAWTLHESRWWTSVEGTWYWLDEAANRWERSDAPVAAAGGVADSSPATT